MSATLYKGMPIWYRIGDHWFKARVKEVFPSGQFLFTHGVHSYKSLHTDDRAIEWRPRSTIFTRLFNKD